MSHELTVPQETALEALLAGQTKSAAAAAGVSREQVSRWANRSAEFIAAWRTRKAELWEAVRAELELETRERIDARREAVRFLRALLGNEEASDADRLKSARHLAGLKILPLPVKAPTREASPEEITRELARNERTRVEDRARSLELEAMFAGLGPAPAFLSQAERELQGGPRS